MPKGSMYQLKTKEKIWGDHQRFKTTTWYLEFEDDQGTIKQTKHRPPDEGPAEVTFCLDDDSLHQESYYVGGSLHRLDGPACIYHRTGAERFYLYGNLVTPEVLLEVVQDPEARKKIMQNYL